MKLSTAALLIGLELIGMGAIWLYVRARLRRALELESLVESIRKEIRSLNMELNETADRNISLVEDRMDALRSLLDEADRRMGVVRRELDTRANEREVYSRLGKPHPSQVQEAAMSPRSDDAPSIGHEPQRALQDGGFGDIQRGGIKPRSRTQAVPAPAASAPLAASVPRGEDPIRLELPRRQAEIVQSRESVIPPKTLREEAIELYRRGFSADIIAVRLGATVAEIDLLVSLEDSRRESDGKG